MSRTRMNDRLSEIDERVVAAAETDLDRLLSIEPSPEFAAKVRARIGAGRRTSSPWTPWRVGLAAASLVLALVLGFAQRGRVVLPEPTTAAENDRQRNEGHPKSGSSVPVVAVPSPAAGFRTPPDTRDKVVRSRTSVPAPVGEPDVVVDPALAEAIRRLAVSARNTVLDETVQHVTALRTESLSLPILVVEPLTVPELVLSPADPGARQ